MAAIRRCSTATAASRFDAAVVLGSFGKGWLEPGGVLVVANLRGGGEFGPDWHRAAQRENKQRTWDDLAAVAEDLIRRGVTSPPHLGIMGGSQGGLLVTSAMVQRPELFGAVVSQVPLIDMLRYHKLLAGASWIAEYGDPDQPADRAFIAKYSPYQNVTQGREVPAHFLVDLDARRPRASWPRAQDGGTHARAGPRRAVLREHRRRPRCGREQRTGRAHVGPDLQFSLAAARPALKLAETREAGSTGRHRHRQR